jgi:hypothetical protein
MEPHEDRWDRRQPSRRRWVRWLMALLGLYILVSYVALPWIWKVYERVRSHAHPALPGAPRRTVTVDHVPGDPLNIALIGAKDDVARAMKTAGWFAADPLSLRSRLRIAEDVLRDRPYLDAPVSNLYVWGRPEDIAFEQPVGDSPRRRHHVRFWRSEEVNDQGHPLWLGAATFDHGVGLSHETGQITHHIAPDIDTERGKVVADLQRAGWVASLVTEPGIWPITQGHNAGGDPFHTDGMMVVVALRSLSQPAPAGDASSGSGSSKGT